MGGGATISSVDGHQPSRNATINSSLVLHLADVDRPIKIALRRGTKLVLGSVCLDADRFRSQDQVKLMIRFVNDADEFGEHGNDGWSCLCNYLGSDRGGQPLVSATPLGLEVLGGCSFELCVRGTCEKCSLHVVCNVLSALSADDVRGDTVASGHRRGSSSGVAFRFLGYYVPRALPVLLLLLSLIIQGNGGFTQSIPSLHPTRRSMDSPGDHEMIRRHQSPYVSRKNLPSQVITKQANTSSQIEVMNSSYIDTNSKNSMVSDSESSNSSNLFNNGQVVTSSSNNDPTQDCIDLTVSFLPSWIGEFPEGSHPVQWSLSSTDGTLISSKNHSRNELYNQIVIDHITQEDGICLQQGSYTFRFNSGGKAHFLLSSGGEAMACGGLFQDELNTAINLPFDSSYVDLKCSTLINCSNNDSDGCLEEAFTPLQCFNNGTEIEVTSADWDINGNRRNWFGETCSVALSAVCQSESSHLGFGAGYETDTLKRRYETFCPYFECANAAFTDSVVNGNTLDAYFGCDCLYTDWTCAATGAKCVKECCASEVNAAGSALATSCDCRIEPDCEAGNAEMCGVALDYCCPAKDDYDERNECYKTYSEMKCKKTMEDGEVDENGDYPYCKQYVEAVCSTDDDASCKCKNWEELCILNPKEAICEKGVDDCCPRDPQYGSFCYCDFYNWASTVGYNSAKIGWCSQSDTFLTQLSSELNDRDGLLLMYESLNGDFWYDNTGWLTDAIICEWHGVDCTDGRVSSINLNGNNLTGDLSFLGEGSPSPLVGFFELHELNLSNNFIGGTVDGSAFFRYRKLESVDLSNNRMGGIADVLVSPSINFVDFSQNEFTTLGYILKSRKAYNTLESVDLSANLMSNEATSFFDSFPPNMKRIIARDNSISGELPMQLPSFVKMEEFDSSENKLSGILPDFSRSMPRVLKIHLARQKSKGDGGISGPIPLSISSLLDLVELDLSGNYLTGEIPRTIGNIPRLQMLNCSDNELTGIIHSELGKLSDVSEVFDLSKNKLSGSIPENFKDFTLGNIRLGNNDELLGYAPLGLCYDSNVFDLKYDASFCPSERNALKEFFDDAKGKEWTNSSGWGEQFTSVCDWHGVICNDANQPVELDLKSNGLSGRLSESLGRLFSLERIDLSDNDIKGSIPDALSRLVNLNTLRLSYNLLTGNLPVQLIQLENLELAHFQSNRLTGEIILNNDLMVDPSSFISDCGVPTDFENTLSCSNCTMCCNIEGGCHTTSQDFASLSYETLLFVLLGTVTGILLLVAGLKYSIHKYSTEEIDPKLLREQIVKEKEEIFEAIAHESIYGFFLTKNIPGWIIALSVMAFQFFVFYFFIGASRKDFSDDKSDFTYSWRCPRNSEECNYLADQTPVGWLCFGVLMLSHLGKDLMQGWKLILMSSKPDSEFRIRFFTFGLLLILITISALYSSTVYNIAIARSNPELVANAVIVLFLMDVDEQLYGFMEVACPDTLDRMMGKTLSPEVPPVLTSSKETACDSIFRSWSIDDEKNGQEMSDPINSTVRSHEVKHIYAELQELKQRNYEKDINDLQSKLRHLEMKLKGVSNPEGSANHHIPRHTQNERFEEQLTNLEQKMDDLRLALQIHTSSSEIMSESIQYLYGKSSEMEEELVRHSHPTI